YFHNWTGNRITCRDWFQLCLKEGLTVFRDQEFSADQRSRQTQRIKDVIRLRARQFPEDAGPLAHPVRPENIASIDNLYTATVYEKGAELIRVLKRLIGDDAFARGMDLYFDRFDGSAATIEDFYSCFETASSRDLTTFRLWYAQAGTPKVEIEETWTAATGVYALHFKQTTDQTPGQEHKSPVTIPLACALLDGEGGHVVSENWPNGERLVILDETSTAVKIELGPGAKKPLLSVNRGFTSPIILERSVSVEERLHLAASETDAFNRWDAFQSLIFDAILAEADGADLGADHLVDALARAAEDSSGDDPAYAALMLRTPDTGELMLAQSPARPVDLHAARLAFRGRIAARLDDFFEATLKSTPPSPFSPDAAQAGIRALRGAAMALKSSLGKSSGASLRALYDAAPDMTESLAALRALCVAQGEDCDVALDDFYNRWRSDPLVLDKWFAAQAGVATVETVRQLTAHRDFDLNNPNRVRSVVATFAIQNLAAFHAPNGEGHTFLADTVEQVDKLNPALAARLLTAFETWRRLEPEARHSAQSVLERLSAAGLSKNASDILSRTLG
ncbi:MAG: DUF3458 domain-containing protein, partial [Pseudomonadota bacterium]